MRGAAVIQTKGAAGLSPGRHRIPDPNMSNTTLVNLATVGSDELQTMPVAVFTAGLEQMSADAIVRFRRMRKLSDTHKVALERFLKDHPEKRPQQESPSSTAQSSDKTGDQSRKKSSEATLWMEMLLRVIAWWEGMDTDDVARAKGIKRRHKKKKASTPPTASAPVSKPAAAPAPPPPAPPTRVEFVQMLWGEGFSLPGGKDFAVRLASAADFTKDGYYLDLAPGLGGGPRAIAKTYGVTVSGIEADAEFAAAAGAISDVVGMSGTAPIRAAGSEGLDMEDFEPAGEHAAIFMRETMFAVEERGRMLSTLHKALSADGSLVLTDFALADDAGDKSALPDSVAHWLSAEACNAYPWTEAEYRAALEAQDYKVERFDDLTAVYLPFIKEGLRRFHDCLQNAKFPPETLTTLMREGNIWLARSQALETGQLSFVHIHARRISPALTGEDDLQEPDAAPEDAAENDD